MDFLLQMPVLLVWAALYGVTMKVADLLNEHGLKLFRGAAILFGILWGLFGAVLIASNDIIANITLAMVVAFIVRMRIDYLNHAIATIIVIISFLQFATFDPIPFYIFLANFIIFGSVKDYVDDVLKRKDWITKITESGWYYVIPTLIYSMVTGEWPVFFVFTSYNLFYNIVKYLGGNRKGINGF